MSESELNAYNEQNCAHNSTARCFVDVQGIMNSVDAAPYRSPFRSLIPPATSTLPSGISVAEWPILGKDNSGP